MEDTITITGTGTALGSGNPWATGASTTTTVPNGGYSYNTSGTTISTITLPNTTGSSYWIGGGGAGQVLTTTGTGPQWATVGTGISSTTPSIKVSGDADFDGDVKIKGHSIVKLLEKMEDRLAILMDPSPEKLEKFQALKKAYDNYKLMEKLCIEDKEENK